MNLFGYSLVWGDRIFTAELTSAIEIYRNSGKRHHLGNVGEINLERVLKKSGHVIIKGPVTNSGQHNADVVTYDVENKKLMFFDNKIKTKQPGESRAKNLSDTERRQRSIKEAIKKLKDSNNINRKLKKEIRHALNLASDSTDKAIWAVANASPEELKEITNQVKRISKRLYDKGVTFADIQGNKFNHYALEVHRLLLD